MHSRLDSMEVLSHRHFVLFQYLCVGRSKTFPLLVVGISIPIKFSKAKLRSGIKCFGLRCVVLLCCFSMRWLS